MQQPGRIGQDRPGRQAEHPAPAIFAGAGPARRHPEGDRGGAESQPLYGAAQERLPPQVYLTVSYYQRWELAMERNVVERGLADADELAALGVTEMGEGRSEYAASEALGAASAEMAAAAVRSAAAGAVELAAAKAMGGMAQALAKDGADRAAGARGADRAPRGKAAAAVPRGPKPAMRAAAKPARRKPPKPKK